MKDEFPKRLKWRAEAMGHSLISFVMRKLPTKIVFRLGELLGKFIWPLMAARQRIIMRNLRILYAGKTHVVDMETLARAAFVRATANLVCSSGSSELPKGKLREMIEIENPGLMEEALAKKNGVVVLLSHMGNWELLTQLHRLFPNITKSGAFYRPLNNPILNERILKKREADGTKLFSKRDSLHQVSGFLRENGVIGILADQRAGWQGEMVPFFGRLTRASPLPGLLVRRCKSEVLALSLRTVAPGKWSARYHAVEMPYNSRNCMKALEQAMQVSFVDVFWLQERWKFYIGKGSSPRDWMGKDDARGTLPHRALIWATSAESELDLPQSCVHGDIEYEHGIDQGAGELEAIDRAKALPVDFIVIFSENPELRMEAKRLGIPVYLAADSSE
ncbi:MAG: hypothetical protein H7Y36_11530 [Armatimonadetes bacterium]|nr:hypothetical protein [Akkermansiaceae bacterium]